MPLKLVQIDAVQFIDDNDNQPTCALNFSSGTVCMFYRTQRFGCNETCLFAPEGYKGYQEPLRRRGPNGDGRLIPGEWCPLIKKG